MVKLKSLKVAFFHPDLGIGGAERLILDVAIALADQGMEVIFLTNHFDKTHAFEELKSGKYPVRVIGDWLPRSIGGLFQALCAYVRMFYLALVYVLFLQRLDEPDCFVVDQIPMAVPILKWTKPKVIYYCHHPDLLSSPPGGILKKLYRKPIDWLETKGTKQSDVILVNSKYTSDVFRKTFPEIQQHLQVLYPTISRAYLTAVRKKTKQPMSKLIGGCEENTDGDIFFLSINRFHPAKNLELALHGLAALKRRSPSEDFRRVRLIIAGGFDPNSNVNDSYFRKLVDLCNKRQLTDSVVFLKSPSDRLKADLLVSCWALIYTPVNEHFGIVPLEAMAASKAVIACNSGGPTETVQDGVSGLLSEDDEESMADCMVKVMESNVAREMGKNGRRRLEKLFSYDAFSSNVMNIVSDVLNV